MYLTVLERLRQHLSVPFQDSRLIGELVQLRDVVRPDIRPGNRACTFGTGTEVWFQKVFHLPSPPVHEILYQVKADSPVC